MRFRRIAGPSLDCGRMQSAVTRMSGVTVAVALLAGLAVPSAQAAGPSPAPQLAVPFAAPGGYLFTVTPAAAATMRAAGASPLMPAAGIWRVPRARGQALAATLRRAGRLVAVDANPRPAVRAADPLRGLQYAFHAITLPTVAPAPRRKILVIDTGLDASASEIADRAPGTTVLANAQNVTGVDGSVEWHGTAVYSTIAAAVDGVGGEGIFPGATVAMWDASAHPLPKACAPAGCLSGAEEIKALDWAIRHHYDVVSMSFGSTVPNYAEFLAVERAVARGILVVAAAGNDAQPGRRDPFEFPASYDHVLSVGASTPAGGWAPFSNRLPTTDLLAPGTGVYATIATGFTLPAGVPCSPPATPGDALWCKVDGTSFATPIAAAAAAFVWSQRGSLSALQVADVLRAGARPGVGQKVGADDVRFGHGLLDVTRSLAVKVPAGDLREPNEDIPMVRGTGGFPRQAPLLRPSRRRVVVAATMDAKDTTDVYELDVPRGARRLKVVLRHPGHGRRTDDLTVCLWRSSATSVLLGAAGGRRLGCSHQRGARADSRSVRLPKGTRRVYVDVHRTTTSTFAGRYTLAVVRS
jgi:membrane-anchored mycosin MYCP